MARTDRPLPRPELEKDNPPAPQPYRRRRGQPKPLPKPYATHALLTIRHAAMMTPWRRAEIASWLRRHADMLQREGTNYSARFTGRYQTR